MNSDLPKVLHQIDGKPLLMHVLETALRLEPDRVVAILGHGREQVADVIDNYDVRCAVQEPQLGTGHAVMQAESELKGFSGDVVILSGDVPLLRADTLKQLIAKQHAAGAAITVLTAIASNPFGYGRIVRDADGEFLRIVEERDATEAERKLDEINSGIYCVDADRLFEALHRTTCDNDQKQYYLTDIIEILRNDGCKVATVLAADFQEIQGINTPEDLRAAETAYQARAGVNS